jgi:hypothetical protein
MLEGSGFLGMGQCIAMEKMGPTVCTICGVLVYVEECQRAKIVSFALGCRDCILYLIELRV